jgi:hypothetical protein
MHVNCYAWRIMQKVSLKSMIATQTRLRTGNRACPIIAPTVAVLLSAQASLSVTSLSLEDLAIRPFLVARRAPNFSGDVEGLRTSVCCVVGVGFVADPLPVN